jgi:hypothetical protein
MWRINNGVNGANGNGIINEMKANVMKYQWRANQ